MRNGTFHHHQGFRERQATQGVNEYVGQGCNRLAVMRPKEEAGRVDGVPDCLLPAVIHMRYIGGLQRPKPIMGSGAGADQQLAVL